MRVTCLIAIAIGVFVFTGVRPIFCESVVEMAAPYSHEHLEVPNRNKDGVALVLSSLRASSGGLRVQFKRTVDARGLGNLGFTVAVFDEDGSTTVISFADPENIPNRIVFFDSKGDVEMGFQIDENLRMEEIPIGCLRKKFGEIESDIDGGEEEKTTDEG